MSALLGRNRTEQSRVGTYPCSSAAGGALPLPAKPLSDRSAAKWSPTSYLFGSPRHPSETGNIRLLHSSRNVFYSFFRLLFPHLPLIPPSPLFLIPFLPLSFHQSCDYSAVPLFRCPNPPDGRLRVKNSLELNN